MSVFKKLIENDQLLQFFLEKINEFVKVDDVPRYVRISVNQRYLIMHSNFLHYYEFGENNKDTFNGIPVVIKGTMVDYKHCAHTPTPHIDLTNLGE